MKVVKIYICLFFSIHIFSQSGEVIYEAKILSKELMKQFNNDSLSKSQKSYLISIFKEQKEVDYKLIFNYGESLFEKEKNLNIESERISLTERRMGKGIYYTDNKLKQIINHKVYYGQEFLIEIPAFSWKLSQENKKIGEYICFKATTIKYLEGRNGIIERNVIAWYTNELPYNFGPRDYNSLPGLILELQEDNLLIKASKITLKPKNKIVIKKPSQGEKVTLKKYDSIVKEMYYRRRRRN